MGRGHGSRSSTEGAGRRAARRLDEYELGAFSRRALRPLGLNVEAPVASYARSYERFLPDATTAGLHQLLARGLDERSEQGERRWLAEHLVIRAPEPGDDWWSSIWAQARAQLGAAAMPARLDRPAREHLLQCLAESRGSVGLADALAAAAREQSRSGR